MKRLLITGAAGGLGRMMRTRLAHLADTIRLSDLAGMEPASDGEEVVQANLADEAAVFDLVAGCDGIVHFGGISVEQPFDPICDANIRGVYNLYEAARAHGHPRIVFASSNHTIGFDTQDRHQGVNDPMKPDGLYGVSKCFGEAMASCTIPSSAKRRRSCASARASPSRRTTGCSPPGSAPTTSCPSPSAASAPRASAARSSGASPTDEQWWDNSAARYLGWRPRDSSARFRDKVEAENQRPAPDAPDAIYQGGPFTAETIHRS